MGHEETIRKLWSAFDRHDGDTAFALYTTDSVAYDIGYSEPLRGREANRKIYDEALKSLPNHQPSRINLLVKGNVAAAELFSSSINTGPLTFIDGAPRLATNRRLEMRSCTWWFFNEEGLMVESHRYYDPTNRDKQLGLIPGGKGLVFPPREASDETGREELYEETIRKLWAALDKHDSDAAFALYTPDSVVYDVGYPEPLRGREANRKKYEEAIKALPDHHPTRINLMVKGNVATAELYSSSTNTGPITLRDGTVVPPNGQRVEMRSSAWWFFNEEGLIVEGHRYYDPSSHDKQLGLIPGEKGLVFPPRKAFD